jgi:hypothetical protein
MLSIKTEARGEATTVLTTARLSDFGNAPPIRS